MPENAETRKKQWSREEVAEKIESYEEAYQRTPSQRQVAEELAVPRSTLQHWLERKDDIDAEPEVVAFFESAVGVAFLHRLVLAAHFVITLLGPSGIRRVCLFLELAGLDQFVAASYGAQQQVSVAMEQSVVAFDKEEKKRLATDMKPKQITVCEDETFHPEVCLVAIEPVSNFILLEQYADDRKAKTWSQAMEEATEGLSVEIVQSTSDEGKGLLCHVKEDLGVHHSPDVFHVQYELVKGTSGALASKKRQAEKTMVKTTKQASYHQKKKDAILKPEGSAECLSELDEKLEQSQEQLRAAQQAWETAAEHQERAQNAIRGLGEVYHPYDLETGAARSAEDISAALEQHFAEIEAVAVDACLSEGCVQRIEKAKRVTGEMVATGAFFLHMVRAKVEALSLAPEVEKAMYHNLIPAIYLHLAAEKTQDVEQRPALQRKSEELLVPLWSSDGPLTDLAPEEKAVLETVAQECAQLFQRSSSCVEGRNGYLALYHHGLHRLGDRKLAALTTVHNYFVKRQDSTTAAERFFGSKPRDLFGWVLDQVDLPGRPARKRSRPKPKEFLVQAAA